MKKKIAVLFGGSSSEHEISRMSASFVLKNLSREQYDIYVVGITKEGKWFLTQASVDEITDGSWEARADNRQAFLSPDRSIRGMAVLSPEGACKIIPLDCVFPVLHGKNGEDGTIQGVLQLAGIPFVGCGLLASAVCMDKTVSHTLLSAAGIPQAKNLWFYASDFSKERGRILDRIQKEIGWPVFVKPANAGSSVGVSKASSPEELNASVKLAAAEDTRIVVEEAVVGQEVECAVLGNEEPEAALVGEIAASAAFYDYDDKYINGTSQLYIPAHLSETVMQEIRSIACRAYRVLGCEGLARVDFFVRGGNEVLLNELNTLPGFTAISMYPKLWEACGVTAEELLERLIQCAAQRQNELAAAGRKSDQGLLPF